MKLSDLMDFAPVGAARKIEEVAEIMAAHVAELGD
jgi:predicted component of type VI protein secretion system